MSYVDAIYIKEKDIIKVVERVDGVRKERQFPAHYVFYYPDNKGQYTGIDGKRLGKVAVATHKAFEKEKKIYENAAYTCPVAKSLHPDIKQVIEFVW